MLKFSLLVLLPTFCSAAQTWSFTLERGSGVTTNYGSLVASRGATTGLVCDDVMDDRTAHYLCQTMGYTRMVYWTSPDLEVERGIANSYRRNRLDDDTADDLGFALDNVKCTGVSGKFEDDCTHTTKHDCKTGEDLILNCTHEPEFRIVSGKGNYLIANEWDGVGIGSVVDQVSYYGIYTGPALACNSFDNDGYTDTTELTDMICRQNGYAKSYPGLSIHRYLTDGNRADFHWAENTAGMTDFTAIDILECDTGVALTKQCEWGQEAQKRQGACNIDDTLVIHCTNAYIIKSLKILANMDGGIKGHLTDYRAGTGTVVAELEDVRSGEISNSLVKAGDNSSSLTAKAICCSLGFGGFEGKVGSYHTQREMYFNERLSAGFIKAHGIKTLISNYRCDSGMANAFGDCHYNYNEQQWDPEDAMVVDCSRDS